MSRKRARKHDWRDTVWRRAPVVEPVWGLLPRLLAVGFLLRVAFALAGDFVLHPDEVMQYLEPAHEAVFGNGVLYWEFFYGGRSWLMPGLTAAVLFLLKTVGLGAPGAYIPAIKIVFCLLSLAVPLAMYFLARRMFSESTARIALIGGLFWYELAIFAHKPFTEFAAAAVLLCALAAGAKDGLSRREAFFVGAACALTAALRMQYLPLAGLAFLWAFGRELSRAQTAGAPLAATIRAQAARTALIGIGGGVAVLFCVGLFEFALWGRWFHSYYFNAVYNLALDQARVGESSAWQYPIWFAAASGGFFVVAVAAGVVHWRRNIVLLALLLALFAFHMWQPHREYRFLFVAIPFWILLLADFCARFFDGKRPHKISLRIRRGAAAALFVFVGGMGALNLLPLQGARHDEGFVARLGGDPLRWIYEALSAETGIVGFVRDQDPLFGFYRRIAAEDEVDGVWQWGRFYAQTGGYYYLHRRVPFYDHHAALANLSPFAAGEYVSHIIAPDDSRGKQVVSSGGRRILAGGDGGYHILPALMPLADDPETLVFWTENGASPIEGFERIESSGDWALWRRTEEARTKAATTKRPWRDYRLVAVPQGQHENLTQIFGDDLPQPPRKFYGIDFAEESVEESAAEDSSERATEEN